MKRNPTRSVRVGNVFLGSGHPVAVQSMCATRTQDVDATVEQAEAIREAGGALVRVAVDSQKDVLALAEVRRQTKANLVVDLQESYRLAETVAPHVDKIQSIAPVRKPGFFVTAAGSWLQAGGSVSTYGISAAPVYE